MKQMWLACVVWAALALCAVPGWAEEHAPEADDPSTNWMAEVEAIDARMDAIRGEQSAVRDRMRDLRLSISARATKVNEENAGLMREIESLEQKLRNLRMQRAQVLGGDEQWVALRKEHDALVAQEADLRGESMRLQYRKGEIEKQLIDQGALPPPGVEPVVEEVAEPQAP